MKAPSTSLLRVFLKPHDCACQTRFSSNFMPREKYAKVTALDKLHRQQKAAIRKERHDSELRANAMQPPSLTSQATSDPSDQPATTETQLQISTLPYSIPRTRSNNLPIYETSKAGGNKHITIMRKLSGDLTTLQTHIREALNLPESYLDRTGRKKMNVAINQTTRQIVVRGWRAPEIKRWAKTVGF